MSGVEVKVRNVIEFEEGRIIVHEEEITRRLIEFKNTLRRVEDAKKFKGIVCPKFDSCDYRIKLGSNEVIQDCVEKIFCNWYSQACDVNYQEVHE